MSKEHKEYLNKITKQRLLVRLVQIFILALIIITWELLAKYEIINTFITSSPSKIVNTIINLHNQNNLYKHIWTTLYETLISFSLGTIIGIVIATLMWWNGFFAKVIDPYLTVINSLPKVALGPILVFWIGANMNSIITMALLISVIVTIINVYNGFATTDEYKIKLLKSFNASKSQIYFNAVLPSSYKTIISSLKINISMTLIGVIMGEFLVSKSGIGYLIMYGSQVFNLNLVMTGIIILCIVAAVLYYVVCYIEKIVLKKMP